MKNLKNELLQAYIAGMEDESHWEIVWESLSEEGKRKRVEKFNKWFKNKYSPLNLIRYEKPLE